VQSGTAQPFFRANAAMQPGFDERSILRLFESVLPTVRWKALEGRAKAQTYTLRVVIWMMLLQRLAERGTQQRVVHGVAQGHLERLLPSSKRVREGKISQNSGAYARACGRLSMETTAQVCDEVLAESRKRIAPELELERPVMLLDGSSLSVEHSPSFLEAFPPGRNRRGLGHRGIVKWVDLHDVRTGIALRPVRGPMYGPQTVSEQVLARQAVERTPAGGVIVGDGNFGIFSFAYAVVQSERETVFRLTKARKRWEQSGCCPTESAEFAGSRAASSGKSIPNCPPMRPSKAARVWLRRRVFATAVSIYNVERRDRGGKDRRLEWETLEPGTGSAHAERYAASQALAGQEQGSGGERVADRRGGLWIRPRLEARSRRARWTASARTELHVRSRAAERDDRPTVFSRR